MYRKTYQRGNITVFSSGGSKPLGIWDTCIENGYIVRFLDQDIKSLVLEIGGLNVSTTYMVCPKGNTELGIRMPFLVMIVKNLHKYFCFEVVILDNTGCKRRFRVANFQSTTRILPFWTVMPIALTDGWNQIQFNLAKFTQRAYNKNYVEVLKLKINANIRLRRIYFAETLLPDDQLPSEYKLFLPMKAKGKAKLLVDDQAEDETKKIASVQKIDDKTGFNLESKKEFKRTIKTPSQKKIEGYKEGPLRQNPVLATKNDGVSRKHEETETKQPIGADRAGKIELNDVTEVIQTTTERSITEAVNRAANAILENIIEESTSTDTEPEYEGNEEVTADETI